MRPDVSELSEFYHGALGGVARRLLVHRIRSVWSDVRGETLLGIGFAAPFMRLFQSEVQRQILCMPMEQGAMRWPSEGPVCSVLASETELPLDTSSVDRVLAVHCLEYCGTSQPVLREIWRVLKPEGRLLLVVPNRRGVWARMDTTPFGHGHPYSRRQLERLLADCLYAPAGWWPSLFMPPFNRRVILNTAVAWERVGLIAWPGFSGVLIVDAQKQIYAPVKVRAEPVRAKLRTAPNASPRRSLRDAAGPAYS